MLDGLEWAMGADFKAAIVPARTLTADPDYWRIYGS